MQAPFQQTVQTERTGAGAHERAVAYQIEQGKLRLCPAALRMHNEHCHPEVDEKNQCGQPGEQTHDEQQAAYHFRKDAQCQRQRAADAQRVEPFAPAALYQHP